MALFRIDRRTPLTPAEAWRRLTDWERHAQGVPLTRIVVETPPPSGPGTVFVARTGLGPLGFDDRMEITRWEPPAGGAPGVCRLEKRGRAITGWAEIEVGTAGKDRDAKASSEEGAPQEGASGGGTYLVWREDLRVHGLPRALDPLTARAGRLLFGHAMSVLLRDRTR
ncbi:SRPBCC family protein [Streptomyces xanthochromogenes]|uniref:SRPBCC family protein n=1 Tax=Streptomyces xanthochromogenes TaxID=67384 RepID=UPI003816DC9C